MKKTLPDHGPGALDEATVRTYVDHGFFGEPVMRTLGFVSVGAAALSASAALAGGASFDAALKLPPYSAPISRSAAAIAPPSGQFGFGPDVLDRLIVDAQERQCRQDLDYASQARGASRSEIQLRRDFSAQSVYDLPGAGYIPYCIWYPQWRLRRLFGPLPRQSIRWSAPQSKTILSAGGS